MQNKGKIFEQKLKQDWIRTMPESSIDRIYDSQSGYKSISNISDFIAYKKPYLFYLECKTHAGNTFPFANLTQYDALCAKVGIPGVRAGVVLYFYDHDLVVYVPVASVTKMKADGKKSINAKTVLNGEYKAYNIPSVKKRVYMDSDYSVLMTTEEGE